MHIQNFLYALTSLTLTNLVTSSPTQAGTLSTPPPPGESKRPLLLSLTHN